MVTLKMPRCGYQKYKKNRCEIPGCDCYERYVSSPDEPSFSEMRFNERLHVYKAILDVDHIDGDRDNMVPSNLWTICSPQHKLKSYENGDYISQENTHFVGIFVLTYCEFYYIMVSEM